MFNRVEREVQAKRRQVGYKGDKGEAVRVCGVGVTKDGKSAVIFYEA